MEISHDTMRECHHFLAKSIHHFRMLNISNREAKILMPEWFIKMLRAHNMAHYGAGQMEPEKRYQGVEIQENYENKLVVFYPYFHYDPDIYAAKIFEISVL